MIPVRFSRRADFPVGACTLPHLAGPVTLSQGRERVALLAIKDPSLEAALLPTWTAQYLTEGLVEVCAETSVGTSCSSSSFEPVECPLNLFGLPDLPETLLRQAVVSPGALMGAMILGTPTVWRMVEGPTKIKSKPPSGATTKAEHRLYTGVRYDQVPFDGLRLPLQEILWSQKKPYRWIHNFLQNHAPLEDMLVLVGLDLLPTDEPNVIRDVFEMLPANLSCGVSESLLRVSSVIKKHWALDPLSLAEPAKDIVSAKEQVEVLGYQKQLSNLDLTLVQRLLNPKMFQDMGLTTSFPKVLLHGPAGVGKTHLLTHCLCRLPYEPLYVHPQDLLGRYVGEGEQALASAFATAWDQQRILVFENIDAWVPCKDEEVPAHIERLVASMLVLLDGIDVRAPVALLATSKTCPIQLDSRVFRPGRIDTWVSLPLPDAETRDALADHYGVSTTCTDTARDIVTRSTRVG
eukprot:GEMP01029184.1.p1 GENE.GEMP01029184.1~~GEMP01029184.1.p1  ORF type:complete len:463 (+),score=91.00 GEMP01029184.1:52-1440(+)